MKRLVDAALVLGATMRLTRFVVRDDLGQWLVKDQIDKLWFDRLTMSMKISPEKHGHWLKYRDGLDCPFCVGFWIGLAVLLSHEGAGRTRAWRVLATALTLNEVAGHLAVLLGDTADPGLEEAEE